MGRAGAEAWRRTRWDAVQGEGQETWAVLASAVHQGTVRESRCGQTASERDEEFMTRSVTQGTKANSVTLELSQGTSSLSET